MFEAFRRTALLVLGKLLSREPTVEAGDGSRHEETRKDIDIVWHRETFPPRNSGRLYLFT